MPSKRGRKNPPAGQSTSRSQDHCKKNSPGDQLRSRWQDRCKKNSLDEQLQSRSQDRCKKNSPDDQLRSRLQDRCQKIFRDEQLRSRLQDPRKQPAIGRKKKWTPQRASINDANTVDRLAGPNTSGIRVCIRDFAKFVACNTDGLDVQSDRSHIMKLYVGQQLNAGLDPATVRTRLEYLKQFRVSLVSPLTSLDNVDAHDLIVKLKRAKALQGGSKLKPLVTIQQLFSPLHTPARGGCAARWLTYQALWWCIICSGCRPNEMCDAVLLLTTTSLKVGYLHRKQNSMPGARKDEPFQMDRSSTRRNMPVDQ